MSNFTSNVYSFGYTTGSLAHQLFWTTAWRFPRLRSIEGSREGYTSLASFLASVPQAYSRWWIDLYSNDPVHVWIETTLLAFIIYMLVSVRKKDWTQQKNKCREKLSETERKELIDEWVANRAPLCRTLEPHEKRRLQASVVIEKVEGSHIWVVDDDGEYGKNSRRLLNMASHDFLGMNQQLSVKENCEKILLKYGCGACGPRGFYGTIDVHLELEKSFAAFVGTEGAILYSDGASASTSTVAAFAKRGDVLVVDEGIYEPLQTGVTLSRSNIHYFRHNDMDDLRRVLEKIRDNDARIGRKSTDQRRFILVEALYKNYGHIAPLDEIVALKEEFSYRLMVDESFSIGTLGDTGRGGVELHGKKRMEHVEISVSSIEYALGGIGGICVGDAEVVDHQRLSGSGYCFSAASPPFTAAAAMEALRLLQDPDLGLMGNLHRARRRMRTALLNHVSKLQLTSDEASPIFLLRLSPSVVSASDDTLAILDAIALRCRENGVYLTSTSLVGQFLHVVPPPALRMTVTAAHTDNDVDLAVDVLARVVEDVLDTCT